MGVARAFLQKTKWKAQRNDNADDGTTYPDGLIPEAVQPSIRHGTAIEVQSPLVDAGGPALILHKKTLAYRRRDAQHS